MRQGANRVPARIECLLRPTWGLKREEQKVSIQTKVFGSLEDFLEWFDQVGDKVLITQTICTTNITVVYSDYAFDELSLSLPRLD